MKYLKLYNESLRDKMTPKSDEEIGSTIATSKMSLTDRLNMCRSYNLSPDLANKLITISSDKELLNYAVEHNNVDIIKMVVERGYNINYALDRCVWNDFIRGVRWCLENGADPFKNTVSLQPTRKDTESIKLVRYYRNKDIKKFLDKP